MYSHSIVHGERALMAPCLQSHFLSLLCNSFLILMTLIPSILCFSRIQRCPCTQRTSTAAEESMNNVLLFNRFFSWYIELEERKKLPCRCDPQFRRCQHCETFFFPMTVEAYRQRRSRVEAAALLIHVSMMSKNAPRF